MKKIKRVILLFLAMLLCFPSMCLYSKAEDAGFTDVGPGSWYYDAVNYVKQNQIMTGLSENVFGPVTEVSRAQVAVVLYRLAGSPEVEIRRIFSDAATDCWYSKAIVWAYDNQIVTGYTPEQFCPARAISREEFCTMLYRYATTFGGEPKTSNSIESFPDYESVSAFSLEAVSWACANNIVTGKTDGYKVQLDPRSSLVRAECAAIIQRFMTMSSGSNYSIASYNLNLNNGSLDYAKKTLNCLYNRKVDIICMQEIGSRWNTNLRSCLSDTVYRLADMGYDEYGRMGIGILYNASKYTLCDINSYYLNNAAACDGYKTARSVMCAEFMDPKGNYFVVFCSHMEWADIQVNANDAQEVRDLADQYRAMNIPVFIAADFNNCFPMYLSQTIMQEEYEKTFEADSYLLQPSSADYTFDLTDKQYLNTLDTIIEALDNGSLTVPFTAGEKSYPVTYEAYHLNKDSSLEEKYAAIDALYIVSIDNIYYDPGQDGFFNVSAGDTTETQLFENASDHEIVYCNYQVNYSSNAYVDLSAVSLPEGLIPSEVHQ